MCYFNLFFFFSLSPVGTTPTIPTDCSPPYSNLTQQEKTNNTQSNLDHNRRSTRRQHSPFLLPPPRLLTLSMKIVCSRFNLTEQELTHSWNNVKNDLIFLLLHSAPFSHDQFRQELRNSLDKGTSASLTDSTSTETRHRYEHSRDGIQTLLRHAIHRTPTREPLPPFSLPPKRATDTPTDRPKPAVRPGPSAPSPRLHPPKRPLLSPPRLPPLKNFTSDTVLRNPSSPRPPGVSTGDTGPQSPASAAGPFRVGFPPVSSRVVVPSPAACWRRRCEPWLSAAARD